MRQLLLICLVLFSLISQAQPGANDPTFNVADVGNGIGTMFNNIVSAAAVQSDGKIVVGGSFTAYNGTIVNHIARLNSDGTLDASFNIGTGANNNVTALAIQPDGKIIIYGAFTSYNGIVVSGFLVRLNNDGTLDPTFNPGTGLSNGFAVSTIVVQSDGKILIGGTFTSYNGTARNRIARISNDGSLDATFNPGTGANSTVSAITIQSDGKIIIGGSFLNYNGSAINRIARINNDGTLDATFNPGTGANNTVSAIAIQSNGQILIGGSFTTYNGTGQIRIARINSNGTLDATLNPGTGTNNSINAIATQSDGKIIIAGSFTGYNGVIKNQIARVNSDGSLDVSFDAGASGGGLPVTFLNIQNDGKIILAGAFQTFNRTAKSGVIRINSDGSLDTSFFNIVGTGANGPIRALALQADGKIIIAGDFNLFNGIQRTFIARLNADGSLDPSFDPGIGPSTSIFAVTIQNDGKILIGNLFTDYNGIPINSIARINSDGSLDPSFNPGTGASAFINKISVQADGKIIVTGNFQTFNGLSRSRIVRLNSDGSVDLTFNPGTGANNFISQATLQSDGKMIIGGSFTSYNGTSANRIARLNSDGTLDGTFNIGTGTDGQVRSINIQTDGKIIISGAFTMYNGISANRIARLNSDGTLDGSFNVGGSGVGTVGTQAFVNAIQPGGKIIIGGTFTDYNGISRNNLARLNSDGTLNESFTVGTGTDNQIWDVAIQSDEKIIIAGTFTDYNGVGRNFLARVAGHQLLYVNDNSTTGDVFTTAIGNDASLGTLDAPYATIDYALSQANAGDTIFVDAGTYTPPNLIINKSIAILGANYTISPNDAGNPFNLNSGRNAESNIVGPTITIGSSNVTIKGIRLTPSGKVGLFMNSTGINNIIIQNNKIDISSGFTGIQFLGATSLPLTSSYYQLTQNRFEPQDTLNNSTGIQFRGLNNLLITGNSFIGKQKINGTRVTTGISGSGLYNDSVSIINNYFDTLSFGLNPPPCIRADFSNNYFRNQDLALTILSWPASYQLSTIRIDSNNFNRVRSNAQIFFRQLSSGSFGIDTLMIKGNIINIDASLSGIKNYSAILADIRGSGTYRVIHIESNTINIFGDYGSFTGNYAGIQIGGNHQNTIISGNEIAFTATNAKATSGLVTFPTSNTGIFIQTDLGAGIPNIPSSANISVTNNKITGFKTSLATYDPSNNTTSPYVGYGNLTSGAAVNINNNSFTNDSISINNGTTSQTLNANCNWYGIAKADSVAKKVTTSTVNFTPWLTDGTDTDLPTSGFQPLSNICNGTPVTVSLNQANNPTCFDLSNGSIDINISGGVLPYSFNWSKQNDASFVNPGTEDLSALPQGTYKLVVTDAIGSKDSISVTLTQPDLLTAIGAGTNVSCYGGNDGSATVTVAGGIQPYSYLWGNNATTQSLNNLVSGNYSVVVTDANGCTAHSNYLVTQPTQLTVAMSGTSASCNGNATATPSGGTMPYSYQWSNGATTQTINGVPHGTYVVIVTDAHGCTITDSFTVKGNSPINPTAQVVNVSCFGGSNGSITITGASGTPPYTYSINGSPYQSSNQFAGLSAGTYTVSVTDATGCVDFVTKTITQPAALSVVLDSMRTACFGVNNGRIYITVSGGSGAKTYNWTGPNGFTSTAQDPNNIGAGNYSVTVIDSKGCEASLSETLLQWPAVTISNSITNVGCRGDVTGAIDLTVSGGTGSGFIFTWTGPNSFVSTSENINGLKAGNYKVTVSDLGSGCSVQQTITVSQPSANLTLSTSKTNATGCNSLGTVTATGAGGTSPYQYSIDGTNYQSSGLFTGLYAGTYTIWVKDANGCSTSKAVSITDNGSDEFEGNNTKGQAKQITIGTAISARIAVSTDVADWFKFTTGSAGSYILTLTHPSASFVFNLYAAGNNTPALTPVSSTAQSKIYNLAANTTHYIDVTGGLSYVCYQLSISTFIATKPNNNGTTVLENIPSAILRATAYPNPHQGQFNIKIESPVDGVATVELFNVNGEKVVEKQVAVQKNVASIVYFTDHKYAVLFYKVVIGEYSAVGKVLGPN
jgi:uncharacterized delta-60 repeat protein